MDTAIVCCDFDLFCLEIEELAGDSQALDGCLQSVSVCMSRNPEDSCAFLPILAAFATFTGCTDVDVVYLGDHGHCREDSLVVELSQGNTVKVFGAAESKSGGVGADTAGSTGTDSGYGVDDTCGSDQHSVVASARDHQPAVASRALDRGCFLLLAPGYLLFQVLLAWSAAG